jgi:hypothetical protein
MTYSTHITGSHEGSGPLYHDYEIRGPSGKVELSGRRKGTAEDVLKYVNVMAQKLMLTSVGMQTTRYVINAQFKEHATQSIQDAR